MAVEVAAAQGRRDELTHQPGEAVGFIEVREVAGPPRTARRDTRDDLCALIACQAGIIRSREPQTMREGIDCGAYRWS